MHKNIHVEQQYIANNNITSPLCMYMNMTSIHDGVQNLFVFIFIYKYLIFLFKYTTSNVMISAFGHVGIEGPEGAV